MLPMWTLRLCTVLFLHVCIGDCGHILAFHPLATRSHMNQFSPVLHQLMEKGHQVTGIFPHKTKLSSPRFKEYLVRDSWTEFLNVLTQKTLERKGGINIFSINNLFVTLEIASKFDNVTVECTNAYSIIDEMLKENIKVDAVMLTGYITICGYYAAHLFNASIIMFAVNVPPPGLLAHMGSTDHPSFMPSANSHHMEPFTFIDRVKNTIDHIKETFLMKRMAKHARSLLTERYNTEVPDFTTVDVSLMLTYLHPPLTYAAAPSLPNIVHVGGLHCKPGEPLPEDLQSLMNNAHDGVIYVSFGSAIKASDIGPEKKQILVETFGSLKHPVIWKWDEDDVPNLPPNVKLSKWVPQQDLLAHPNLKVFVTHGGLLSLYEAIYHTTPLVGIPLVNDQKGNMLRAAKHGYVINLEWDTLSTKNLVEAITKASDDPSLKVAMTNIHKLFMDQKEPPLERAVWWVEYIIQHKGASFLKPASLQLTWWQYHLLDVLAFLALVALVVIVTFISCCLYLKRFICVSKQKME